MDVNRCVELHNEIVKLGWEGLERKYEDFEARNWFEAWGAEAEAARPFLSPDIISFLERAHANHNNYFHYYVDGLHHPTRILTFDSHKYEEAPLKKKRRGQVKHLILYAATNLASHPDGLIFDQETNTAILCMSIWDRSTVCNGRIKWYPLETVLEAWLDMIKQGKIKAVKEDNNVGLERYEPWALVPYTEGMLQETIVVFNKLVKAIEDRMPGGNPATEIAETGLVDEDILDSLGIPSTARTFASCPYGFAYDFIRKAQRPRFRFIAPGLEVPTPTNFADQPFSSLLNDPDVSREGEYSQIPPVCLFRSSQLVPQSGVPASLSMRTPFQYPYHKISKYPAGLYFSHVDPSSRNRFDDEVVLILPYGIGAVGYARTSDGSRFGENTEEEFGWAKNTFAELYQPGHQPFTERHGVTLLNVLNSWLGMVERVDWKVGENGVMGGINEWKKADTRSGWEKYVIPVGWR